MKNHLCMLVLFSFPLVAMYQCRSTTLNYKLLQAAKEGTETQVEDLLLAGADPLATPSTIAFRHEIPLMVALNFKNKPAWRVLMDYRFEEQARVRGLNGYTLLHYVAGNHCIELFERLKIISVDDINDCNNIAGETSLIRAIEGNAMTDEQKLKMIEELLNAGANPTMDAGEGNALSVAKRQPFPIKDKILELLHKHRD